MSSEWRDDAACLGLPVEWFVSDLTSGRPSRDWLDRALGVCRGCPVANPCLLDALQIRDVEAIRGGTLGRERFAALKRNQESPAGAFEELRRHDGSPV